MWKVFVLFFVSHIAWSQSICNPNGNLIIYSNYDGGILTINVDQNIPNLILGICTYEPIQVTLSGPFVSNVTQVIYAGFNSAQNNNNCLLGNYPTSITGVNPSIVVINPPQNPPSVGYTPQHNNGAGPWGGLMVGVAGLCDTNVNAGGGNTPDEIVYYFQNTTGATLRSHFTQYACWLYDTLSISQGGNCCILPPSLCPNPIDLTTNVTQTTCGLANASIEVLVNGLNQGSFSWSPNVSNENVSDSLTPNTYQVFVNLNGCYADTSISILPSSAILSVQNLITAAACNDNNGELVVNSVQGGQAPYNYILSGIAPQVTSTFANLAGGAYSLTVEDVNGCQLNTQVTIPILGAPNFIQYEKLDPICTNDKGFIKILGAIGGNLPYVFTVDGVTVDSVSLGLNPGIHMLTVTDANQCSFAQNVMIFEGPIASNLFFPNVFTPNADFENDLWCLQNPCGLNIQGAIQDRWGNLVCELSTDQICWDGLHKNERCAEGIYFYSVIATFENQSDIYHGFIHLIK